MTTLTYPGKRDDLHGQVVGPTWLNERWIITAIVVGEWHTYVTLEMLVSGTGETRSGVAPSDESKQEFVLRYDSWQRRYGDQATPPAGERRVVPVPSWPKLREAEEMVHRPHCWFESTGSVALAPRRIRQGGVRIRTSDGIESFPRDMQAQTRAKAKRNGARR